MCVREGYSEEKDLLYKMVAKIYQTDLHSEKDISEQTNDFNGAYQQDKRG